MNFESIKMRLETSRVRGCPRTALKMGARLARIEALAQEAISMAGLAQWTFSYMARNARSTLGQCQHYCSRIRLNPNYVLANSDALVIDTILHELAHALAGPMAGHGPEWVQWCRRLGCVPSPCKGPDEGCVVRAPKKNWAIVCPKCGVLGKRNRRSQKYTGATHIPCGNQVRWVKI